PVLHQRALALRGLSGRVSRHVRAADRVAVAALHAARRDLPLLSHTPSAARWSGRPFFGRKRMHVEGVDLEAPARREGTPLYVYSAAAIHGRLQGLQSALHGMDALVCYAVKANSNQAILQLVADAGAGADIVSGGELWRCLRAGIPADRIVFSGVGKRADEIEQALDAGVARFNVESRAELELIQQIAAARGEVARASVRINPDVDALTHAKISTGKSENKFGVSIAEARSWFAAAGERPAVRLDGLHM